MDQRERIRRKFEQLAPAMSERARRLWAGAEADALGRGGLLLVAQATGLARSTVGKGKKEVRAGVTLEGVVRDRRPGAGRKRLEKKDPGILEALEGLLDPATRGDPMSPLRWTSKSRKTLAEELSRRGHPVGPSKVGQLLNAAGYTLQGTSQMKEGKDHPDRDAQFEFIAEQTRGFIERKLPVISVDTKKKELVGDFSNRGKDWQPKGKPVEVLTYSFSGDKVPKAIPYGVYDVSNNNAFVNVGTDHDTPVFAVHSIERWWTLMGSQLYPKATELLITADSGGSNASKSRVWKAQLQDLADRLQLTVHVRHYPPGTSKWNKIEHRLFSFISLNWRGRPLLSYETVVSLIGATTTRKGLRVSAALDAASYPTGIKVKRHVMRNLALVRADFQGQWNYSLLPRTEAQIAQGNTASPIERDPVSQAERRAKWSKLFREQQLSGLSLRGFCREKGLNFAAFSTARRRMLGPIRRSPAASR